MGGQRGAGTRALRGAPGDRLPPGSHGLRVDAHGELGVSLLPYASAQIEQAAHWWELPAPEERAATYLRLLTAQMGVGGDDSWGSPVHDEFHVDASDTQVLDVTLSLI